MIDDVKSKVVVLSAYVLAITALDTVVAVSETTLISFFVHGKMKNHLITPFLTYLASQS